jgi:hypothetical protein
MITHQAQLHLCRCGSIPVLSEKGASAFVFCPNGECAFTGFRMPSAEIARAAWQSHFVNLKSQISNLKSK